MESAVPYRGNKGRQERKKNVFEACGRGGGQHSDDDDGRLKLLWPTGTI